MSVRTTDNTPNISAVVRQRANLALRFMLDDIDRISGPKTPKRLGDLRRNKIKQVLGLHATIQWRQQYAAIQEDKQHRNYSTAGTGPHYAENAVREVTGNAGKYFRKAGL